MAESSVSEGRREILSLSSLVIYEVCDYWESSTFNFSICVSLLYFCYVIWLMLECLNDAEHVDMRRHI